MLPKIYVYGTEEKFRNYARAIEMAGGLPCFGVDPKECAGLLLPGGGDMEPWRYGQENIACRDLEPERDAAEFALLEQFTAWKKPIMGVCRGMQSINVFFGGSLTQDIPNHSQINGADRLHIVRCVTKDDPMDFACSLYGEECIVNSSHHQCVDRLGNGLCVIQRSSDGIAEAFYHKDLPVWGVQWHPERMIDPNPAQAVADGTLVYRAFIQRVLGK